MVRVVVDLEHVCFGNTLPGIHAGWDTSSLHTFTLRGNFFSMVKNLPAFFFSWELGGKRRTRRKPTEEPNSAWTQDRTNRRAIFP